MRRVQIRRRLEETCDAEVYTQKEDEALDESESGKRADLAWCLRSGRNSHDESDLCTIESPNRQTDRGEASFTGQIKIEHVLIGDRIKISPRYFSIVR